MGKYNAFKLLFVFILLILVGCVSGNAKTYTEPNSPATPTTTATPIPKPSISYTVISIEKGLNTKCILYIRLPNRILKNDIGPLAEYIFQNEGAGCSPLFIFYFLPGETPGIDSAWAYSNFEPQLVVGINGSSLETEATLAALQPTVDNTVVGIWLDTWGLSHTVIIRKVNGVYQMTSQFSDGSEETITLTEHIVNGEQRLYGEFGTYMVIENNGNLGVYDSQGLIYECKPK
jgi:hypothetical protein